MRGVGPLLIFLFFSCGDGDSTLTSSQVKTSAQIVIGALGSVMDEEAGEGFSGFAQPSAFCLDRASVESCVNGRRSKTYQSCEATLSTFLSGTVSLNYSDNSCGLSTISNTVTRTSDLVKTLENGDDLQIFSSSKDDYLGNNYGGGGKLTVAGSNSYLLEVLGKHISKAESTGFEEFDLSMRTTSAITVTTTYSDLRRDGRGISGGSLEVAHNRLKYLTTYSFSNLTYSSGCCHPISGSMELNFSEGATGDALIEFDSTCSTASLTMNSQIETIILSDCNF